MNNPYQKYSILQLSDEIKATEEGYKFITVPMESLINDERGLINFKNLTLGGHKKHDTFTGLEKAITQGQIEQACYWSIQLVCSGYINQVWDRLTAYAMKNINIASPNMPMWLASKSRLWISMTHDKKEFVKDGILHTRNLQQFRNIIAEMVVMLCQTRKRKLDTGGVKITEQDFIIEKFYRKCVARDKPYLKGLVGPNDTKEIIAAANEFYHYLLNKDITNTLYWLHWILNWEKQNIKRYKSFQVQARQIEGVSDIYQRDVIWLVWSIFHIVRQRILEETRRQNPIMGDQITKIEKQLNALWDLYILGWKPGSKARKLPLLIWSIQYMVYPLDWSIGVIMNMGVYIKVVASINKMYTKLANTQCTEPPPSSIRGQNNGQRYNGIDPLTTAIQNNYKPMSGISMIDAVPSPPMQINTQMMNMQSPISLATSATLALNERSATSINSMRDRVKGVRKATRGMNRELTGDERARLEWMTIGLE